MSLNPANTTGEGVAAGGLVAGPHPGTVPGGAAPSLACSWDEGEFIEAGTPAPKANVVDFNVPSILQARLLYGALWSSNSNAAENWAIVQVDLWKNGTKIGRIPLSGGTSTNQLPRSIPSLLTGGGVVDQNSLILTLTNPQTWATSPVILQPFNFTADIDRVTASIVELKNVTGVRLYLGAFSYAA